MAPALIKRLKHHFHAVPEYSAELVLGCNGFVWIQERLAGEPEGDAAVPMQDDGGWGRESDKVSVGACGRRSVHAAAGDSAATLARPPLTVPRSLLLRRRRGDAR